MKKWMLTSIISSSIVLVATANEPEKKADYLANKKKHIESRGNTFDTQQWSDHFDALGYSTRTGLLSCGGKVCPQGSEEDFQGSSAEDFLKESSQGFQEGQQEGQQEEWQESGFIGHGIEGPLRGQPRHHYLVLPAGRGFLPVTCPRQRPGRCHGLW